MNKCKTCDMNCAVMCAKDWDLIDDNREQRMDVIGQNGNTGEHYDRS